MYSASMDSTTEEALEARLRAAKARMAEAEEIRRERQAAVLAAVDAEMSKYKIAAILDVSAPTVTSILKAARRAAGRE